VEEEWEFFEPLDVPKEDSRKLVREMRDDREKRILGGEV
jgi:hypothetical protein